MTATRAKTTNNTKTFEQAANDAKEVFETNVQAAQKVAVQQYEKAVALTKEQVEKVSKQAFASYDELATFNKDTVDAVLLSGSILAKGAESVSRLMVAFVQETMEQSASMSKALFSVKTLREAVDLQTGYAKTSFDKLVAEATKVSELSVKVTNDSLQPISARVNAAIEKIGKAKQAA